MAKSKKKKKKNKAWLIVLMIVILMLVYVIATYIKQTRENASEFVRYPAFGIDVPMNYEIHGIDVSKHQGYISWAAVKNMTVENVKIGFVFMKATEGLNNVDKQFRRNWIKAKEAGITRGAYHFFLATKNGKLQAKNFINTVKLEAGDLPPVLDIEELYGIRPEVMRQQVKLWLQVVEETYKVRPVIYTYVDFYNRFLGSEFDEYPLWIAHYFAEQRPRINRDWLFWQISDGASIDGIITKTDFDVFNADSATFKALLVKP